MQGVRTEVNVERLPFSRWKRGPDSREWAKRGDRLSSKETVLRA